MSTKTLVPISQAARLKCIPVTRLQAWCRDRVIRHVNQGTEARARYYVYLEDIDAELERRTVEPVRRIRSPADFRLWNNPNSSRPSPSVAEINDRSRDARLGLSPEQIDKRMRERRKLRAEGLTKRQIQYRMRINLPKSKPGSDSTKGEAGESTPKGP